VEIVNLQESLISVEVVESQLLDVNPSIQNEVQTQPRKAIAIEDNCQIDKNDLALSGEDERIKSSSTGNSAPSRELNQKEYDTAIKLFELYTNVQVNSDTVYFQRTSIITLTLGLLFVGYQGVKLPLEKSAIAFAGCVLGVLWYFFEQRNLAFFKGRGNVLREMEQLLLDNQGEDRYFQPFWLVVPKWVRENATRFQRTSAQLILKTWIPLMFVVVWALLGFVVISGAGEGRPDASYSVSIPSLEKRMESSTSSVKKSELESFANRLKGFNQIDQLRTEQFNAYLRVFGQDVDQKLSTLESELRELRTRNQVLQKKVDRMGQEATRKKGEPKQ
jgi:hypothetical protein